MFIYMTYNLFILQAGAVAALLSHRGGAGPARAPKLSRKQEPVSCIYI